MLRVPAAALAVLLLTVPLSAQGPKVVITSPASVNPPVDVGVTAAGELKVSCTGGNCGAASASALLAGTLAATTSAAALGSGTTTKILVQNDPDNTVDVLVGNSTTQPLRLRPGDSAAFDLTNLNIVWAKTASGTGTVNYVAR